MIPPATVENIRRFRDEVSEENDDCVGRCICQNRITLGLSAAKISRREEVHMHRYLYRHVTDAVKFSSVRLDYCQRLENTGKGMIGKM